MTKQSTITLSKEDLAVLVVCLEHSLMLIEMMEFDNNPMQELTEYALGKLKER